MMDAEKLIQEREAEKAKLGAVIDAFAEEMKARAFQKVDEGYSGWDIWEGWKNISPMARLIETAWAARVEPDKAKRKRRCVDAANFAMFDWHLRQSNG
jgi:hypothetical protein